MLKLSFILPCYNVAPYVGRCIESIEHQDIPQSEYEVICVDDCSKDNTADVIREYQKQYPNVRLICHEVNKTAGGARNTGMDAAKGEYLWFVDPDDAIVSEEAEMLYGYAHKKQLDILVFNYLRVEDNNDVHECKQISEYSNICNGQDFFIQYFPQRRMADFSSIWRELYKRSFCVDKSIRYPEIKAAQDVVFAWDAFLKAEKLAAVPTNGYICYRRATSTTGSKGRLAARAIISQSILFAYEIYKLLGVNETIYSPIRADMDNAIGYALNIDSRNILYAPQKEQHEFYKLMQHYKDMIKVLHAYMNRKTKQLFAYKIPYSLWQCQVWVYRIVNNIKQRESIKY